MTVTCWRNDRDDKMPFRLTIMREDEHGVQARTFKFRTEAERDAAVPSC